MTAKVYVVGNFKGGVGKTKVVTMLAYESSQDKKRKTLVIDLDPQGNATSVLAKTGNIDEISLNITDGFISGDISTQITPIMDNLDLIAGNTPFSKLPKILMSKFPNDDLKQVSYLKELIRPLKEKYDSIYIDVPPTISDFSDNAMLASDYCIIILQTQELSLDGAKTYINYMQYLIDKYEMELNVLGIVPCLLRPGGRVDKKILKEAKQLYGSNLLDTIINYQERLKAYDSEGITNKKMYNGSPEQWDARAHTTFLNLLNELDEHEDILSSER